MRKFLHQAVTFLMMIVLTFTFATTSYASNGYGEVKVQVTVVLDNAKEYQGQDFTVDQEFVWIGEMAKVHPADNLPMVYERGTESFKLKNNEQKTFKFWIYDNQLKMFDVRPYVYSDEHFSLDYIEFEKNTEPMLFNEGTEHEISLKTSFKISDDATDGSVILHYSYNPDVKPIEKIPPNPICNKQVDYLGDGDVNEDTELRGKNNYRMYLDFITEAEEDVNKADVIFVADVSGSMGGSQLSHFKTTMKDTIEGLLENPDNRISLITFSTKAQVLASKTTDLQMLKDKIDNLVADGNTCFYEALACTRREVANINADKDSDRETIVIFLTDGQPDKSISNSNYQNFSGIAYGYDEASKIKGVSRFFSIYMGWENEPAAILQNLTKYVQTSKSDEKLMIKAKNPEEIRYALDEFLGRMGNGLSDVTINDNLSDYVEVPGNADVKATYLKDGKIVVLEKDKDFTYQKNAKNICFKLLSRTTPESKYTFSYNLKASDLAFDYAYENNSFPNIGDKGTDFAKNKTSSGKNGFFAQKDAKLSYTYAKDDWGEKEYAKPVIQVALPEPIDVPITLHKTLDGKKLVKDMFTFYLFNSNDVLIETQKNKDNGNIDFTKIKADKPGKYSFVVKEHSPSEKTPYSYDSSKKQIGVSVVRIGDDLKATVNYPQVKTFENKYVPYPAYVTLNAKKIVKKGTLKNKEFKFCLSEEDGTIVENVYNNSTGDIIFSPIKFTKVGNYNYKIFEVAPLPADPNMIYDTSILNISVKVVDDEGQLVANVIYPEDKTFVNEYMYKPIDAGIETEVVLTGMQLSTGLFDFKMVDEETNEKFEACNFSDGKITFNCHYTTIGEHNYVVTQKLPAKPIKHMIYDEEPIYLKVNVVDRGNGVIEPIVTCKDKSKFYNAYKVLGGIW